MKKDDLDDLIERLQGFDDETLRSEMTDGLDEWCHRRRRGRTVRRVLLVALLLLTTTAIAMTALPLLRPAGKAAVDAAAPAPAPLPPAEPAGTTTPVDSVVVGRRVSEPVDYYYTGVAEDGYSLAYGHDTRTLTYTRYSGSHLIHSVVHNSPDIFAADSAKADSVASPTPPEGLPSLPAVHSQVACDFQTVSPQGDALYFVVIDSVRQQVSVRGDVARWMGQPIRYNALLTIPDTVEHEGRRYAVTALADSAFMGHDEIETVSLPVTVTRIGDYAFAGCSALSHLAVHTAVPPEAFAASFDRVDAMLWLSVPCGSGNAYANDAEWLYFRNLLEDCARTTPQIRVIRRP